MANETPKNKFTAFCHAPNAQLCHVNVESVRFMF